MKPRSKAIKSKAVAKGAGKRIAVQKDFNSDRVWALIVFVLAFALYANTITHAYVMDDYGVLHDDFLVKRGIRGISTILQRPYRYGSGNLTDNLYRPFSQVMFAVEWEISPGNPVLSHFCHRSSKNVFI